MADTVQFSIIGLDSLLKKFDAINHDVRYKGGRFALRKAAQLVRDAAKQNALALDDPDTGRSIAANIAERWNGKLFRRTGDLGFRVGVLHGARLPKNNLDEGAGGPTPHWRLLEFGTEKMAARPFMRPALENNINAATNEFAKHYEKAIDRAIKRAARGK
jgi:HK97 gp10 family phage protein